MTNSLRTGNSSFSMGKIHDFYGPFSIAMLNYQRVDGKSSMMTNCSTSNSLGQMCIHFPLRINLKLICGFNPSEKYEFVSWDSDFVIPNIRKHDSKKRLG